MSNSLQPHGLQHARFPCPTSNPHSLLKLLSIHLVMPSDHLILCRTLLILPSIIPSIMVFPMSQLFTSQSIRTSPSASVLPMNIQNWFPLGFTGLISLQSKGLSRVFSKTTVQKHQILLQSVFFMVDLTFIHDYWKNKSFYLWTFISKVMSLLFNIQRLVM